MHNFWWHFCKTQHFFHHFWWRIFFIKIIITFFQHTILWDFSLISTCDTDFFLLFSSCFPWLFFLTFFAMLYYDFFYFQMWIYRFLSWSRNKKKTQNRHFCVDIFILKFMKYTQCILHYYNSHTLIMFLLLDDKATFWHFINQTAVWLRSFEQKMNIKNIKHHSGLNCSTAAGW